MQTIRQAEAADASRIAEIEIFNYRLYFYPIFRSDAFYFGDLQVTDRAQMLCSQPELLARHWVYDDGVVKGFIRLHGREVEKLFAEPVLHRQGIGSALLDWAIGTHDVRELWALEKNERALRFYARHGFAPDGQRKPEEDTDEYLLHLVRG